MCTKSEISLQYSNGTVRPNCGPNKAYLAADAIESRSVWAEYPHAFRAEFASDWDCGEETPYWYVIKDTPFDVNALKAKRRYEITKGSRNFTVRRVNVKDEMDGMYSVYTEAITGYKITPPPQYSKEQFIRSVEPWNHYNKDIGGGREMLVYGAFDDSGRMCGYAHLVKYKDHCSFSTLKTRPSSESKGINAAICYQILTDLEEDLSRGDFFISDGARNLFHQTHFQDYLQKYFGFRKAYCRLNVVYRPLFGLVVKVLYPMRKVFRKLDSNRYLHMVNAVLLAEEISRTSHKSTKR